MQKGVIKILYYYTSVDTMKYILQGANIFATNLLYMNDAEEYSNGLRELKDIINFKQGKELITEERLRHEMEKEVTRYSISFSTAKDLLSQWSMYAGESGVSLAMEFSGKERYQAYTQIENKREVISYLNIYPQKVHYCTKAVMKPRDYDRVKEAIWAVIQENYSSTPATLGDFEGNVDYIWTEMTPYVKRYEFSAEEEYRLGFDWTQLLQRFRIDYRNDGNVLKPYLDIRCEGGWPIREITVGPGFNQDVVFKSIVHFLNHSKIEVPELSGINFSKQCKRYLDSCGTMPCKAAEIWETQKKSLNKKDKDIRYKIFSNIRNEIMDTLEPSDPYRCAMNKKEIAKEGIIISRSGIPYIF